MSAATAPAAHSESSEIAKLLAQHMDEDSKTRGLNGDRSRGAKLNLIQSLYKDPKLRKTVLKVLGGVVVTAAVVGGAYVAYQYYNKHQQQKLQTHSNPNMAGKIPQQQQQQQQLGGGPAPAGGGYGYGYKQLEGHQYNTDIYGGGAGGYRQTDQQPSVASGPVYGGGVGYAEQGGAFGGVGGVYDGFSALPPSGGMHAYQPQQQQQYMPPQPPLQQPPQAPTLGGDAPSQRREINPEDDSQETLAMIAADPRVKEAVEALQGMGYFV